MFYQILGIGIILITLSDVYLTVLYPRTGKSVISLKISQATWELFRRIAHLPIRENQRVLAYCGPTLLVVIVVFWVCACLLGFSLLIWPALGTGIQASQGKTPDDFATAFYYSGFTLTTLGVGDLVPKTGFWRLVTVLEAAIGFSIITASLTYLLSVYNALTRRNSFALSLYHRNSGQADAALLLVRLKGYGKFQPALSEISSISRDLLYLLESHHAYPILHYFRFREPHYSLARMALISLDLATLTKTALHGQAYEPLINSAAVNQLHSGAYDLLTQLASSFLGQERLHQPTCEKEWRDRYWSAIAYLQQHDIKTVADCQAGADQYVAHRRQWNGIVLAFANYMDYRWSEITAACED